VHDGTATEPGTLVETSAGLREVTRAQRLEAALLSRPWKSFRVPDTLATGEYLLLLEYVPHGVVLGSRKHAAAIGRALAEIHTLSFEQAF